MHHRAMSTSRTALWPIAIAVAILLGSVALTQAGAAPAAGSHTLSIAEASVLPVSADGPGQAAVRVISRETDAVHLQFDLPQVSSQVVVVDGEQFNLLEIEGGAYRGADGQPMLPTFSRMVQIPDEAGVTVEVTAVETQEFPGVRPFPMQPEEGAEFVIDRAAYAAAGFGDAPRVSIGEPAIARDLRIVPITFSPVRYDPARNVTEVASRIEVAVRFAGVDLRNANPQHNAVLPPSFDNLYQSLVVNYDGPRSDQTVSLGSYVIICPNNAAVLDAIAPLVEWRTRKGFIVRVATTAETGSTNTAIQTWLRNAYNSWENPPEYITLVGDANGTIAIPCWNYSGGDTDHPYSQLDGADILADAHVGRISVDTIDRLALAVTKIVGYESTPYMSDPGWYTRACLVGDPRYSGITCVQVMQWIKTRLRQVGYTQIDTIWAEPFVNNMTTSLNRGTTVFAYRGYIGMSGWGTGNISSLTNGWKMVYAVNLTCGTGNFSSGTSVSEAWLRAGLTSPPTPTGGIASIGTATSSTHTRFNNCMLDGVFYGLTYEGLYTFGQSLTRGKYELYVNYGAFDSGGCANFTHWNNLMGEAAGECWTGLPQTMSVSHPASIPLGTNSVRLTASSGVDPIAGAMVCLWKGSETWICGTTDSLGQIELPVSLPTTGQLKVTVTKHNFQPYLATVPVVVPDLFVGYSGHSIDDDSSGQSSGNGDGVLNPTETIEIPVQVHNSGTETAYGVTGTITTDDPYVTIIADSEEFGDIAAGGSAWGDGDFVITLAGGAPDGHMARVGLDIHSGAESWHSLIEIPAVAAAFAYESQTLSGAGATFDPGESAEMSVRITNIGSAPGTSVTGRLASMSGWLAVTDPNGSFGTIAAGSSGENTSDRFALRADPECYQGHIASLVLYLDFSNGMRDTVDLVVQVGSTATDDPTGPDHYGYYAFDETDAGYEYRPAYHWIEIDPAHGGSGTDVGLNDYGGDGDDSRVVDLPFPFTYYGQTFTHATICSNGWMAMGSTYLEDQRNWNIPAAGAPQNMLAVVWDDLYQSGTNKVYQLYQPGNHRFIVQWSRVYAQTGGTENVEIILYDPAYHETPTGDGMIEYQYDTFSNTDYTQHYCTVGIENGDLSDGVLITYFNRYAAGSPTIVTGRVIRFIALPMSPRGTLTGTVRNSTNGGTPLAGATVTVTELEQSYTTDDNGNYVDIIPTGTYTLIASHPSFAPDTVSNVEILAGETAQVDFALEDIRGPMINQTTQLPTTSNTAGPYLVHTHVTDYSDFETRSLFYDAGGQGWVELPLESEGGDLYRASIPGQGIGTLVRYYVLARDIGGNGTTDPADAPAEAYEFWVVAPLFSDDMESGPGWWTHYPVSAGFGDQWHLSQGLNHSPLGTYSWKFGDQQGGDYAPLGDGALQTAPIIFDGTDAILTFWHSIDAEAAGPMSAYDGGIVEMSVDGGPWTQLMPLGGYGYRITLRAEDPGPFAEGTPAYSGTFGWRQASFRLLGIAGAVNFRFRFGSDGVNQAGGWYIDDIEVLPDSPSWSGTDEVETLPTELRLHAGVPNPVAAGGASINFDLPQATAVRLGIYDVGGRMVRELVHETLPAGYHTIAWNGRGEDGRSLASGVYFYVLTAGRHTLSERTMLVR